MYIKKIATLTGAVAIIDRAASLSLDRHQQNQPEEKRDAIDWVTEYYAVYVTEGVPKYEATIHADDATTVSSVSVVVVPTQQPNVDNDPVQKTPVPTSLMTSVKPAQTTQAVPFTTGGIKTEASPSGPGFSGKRGLAYTDPVLANLFGSSCKKSACGWAYNWDQSAGALNSQYSYVPMLWGNGTDKLETWDSTASKAILGGSKALFSFNEPDNASQSNMRPDYAADLHVKYMNPYSGKALIGAPAVSNSNLYGEGLSWLKNFVQACESKGCKYDFCNVHWYNSPSAIETLFDHIEQAHHICGSKPIWLTEFAPTEATSRQAADFMSKVVPRLEVLDYLDAYSYFMVSPDSAKTPNSLLSSLTSLSSPGNIYASI